MLIGYMRVSKADGSQSTDLQRDALRAAGVTTRRLYEDRASGRLDARPGLDAALKALRRGDTLIVWKLDRLGRDLISERTKARPGIRACPRTKRRGPLQDDGGESAPVYCAKTGRKSLKEVRYGIGT